MFLKNTRKILGGLFTFGFLFVAASVSAEVKPADFDTASGIKNTVTVTGTAGGVDITDLGYEVVAVEAPNAAVTLSKDIVNSTPTGPNSKYIEGDTITYEFTVENTGNVYLYDVTITDAFADASGTLTGLAPIAQASQTGLTSSGATGTSSDGYDDADFDKLAPGDIVKFQASYTVTATDMSNKTDDGDGVLRNTASVSTTLDAALTGETAPTATSSEVTAELDYVATISIVKSASLNETNGNTTDSAAAAGDVITYTYTVTNTGTVNLTDVGVSDVHGGKGSFTQPSFKEWTTQAFSTNADADDDTIEILRPGAVAVFETTYTVVQDDIDQLQ